MKTVIIVIHLMVVLALVGVVLLQRSEGGGLGIGGGGGFMTARGAANALTRTTAILAIAFFATSLGLSILARYSGSPTDILDNVPSQTQPGPGGAGVLDQLGGAETPPATTAPASDVPAPAENTAAPATGTETAPAAQGESTTPAAPATPQVPTGQ